MKDDIVASQGESLLTRTKNGSKSNLQLCLETSTPNGLSEACRGLTSPEKILEARMPTLSAIKCDIGIEKMKAYIATHLAAMSKFLGLKERLSSEHIDFVADELIENYGQWMTVADINLVIKRIKCGYYGELYNDLNAQKVLGIFSKYDIERDEAVARHRSSEMKKSSVMADKSWFTVKDGKYVMKTDYFVAQVRNLIMEKELNGIGADYRRRMVAALDNLIISAFAMKEFEKHVLPEDVKDVPTGRVNVADLRKFVYKKIKTEYYRDHGNKEEQGAGEAAQGTGETGEGDK